MTKSSKLIRWPIPSILRCPFGEDIAVFGGGRTAGCRGGDGVADPDLDIVFLRRRSCCSSSAGPPNPAHSIFVGVTGEWDMVAESVCEHGTWRHFAE